VVKLTQGTTASPDTIQAMPLDLFFDFLGLSLNGPKAAGQTMVVNWNVTDTKEQYVLSLENAALNHTANKQAEGADATITLTRAAFNEVMLLGMARLDAKIASGNIKVGGKKEKLQELRSMMDKFDPWFNIVTP
jgi:alkyl sulfatase BDS1-like metallo-beta-lactamase superfamily hydrolase